MDPFKNAPRDDTADTDDDTDGYNANNSVDDDQADDDETDDGEADSVGCVDETEASVVPSSEQQ